MHVCGPRDQLEGRRADQGALGWPSIPVLGMMELLGGEHQRIPTSGTSVHPVSEAARVRLALRPELAGNGLAASAWYSGLAASGLAGSGWLASG